MQKKKEFGKKNTLMLKGIAIIMMIFHHCFWSLETFEGHNVSFFPFDLKFVVDMSYTFKICVSIFVFITGYGLILSFDKLKSKGEFNNKGINKWIVNRLIKTFSSFWIVAIISYIVCQLIDGKTWEVFFESNGIIYGSFQMIIDCLGLSSSLGTSTLNPHWWYMSLALLLIISIPFFDKILKKHSSYLHIFLIITIFPRVIDWGCKDGYIAYLYPFVLGIMFAKNNLMVKIANFKINKNNVYNKLIKFIIETVILIVLYVINIHLSMQQFWEIKLGIIPVFLMCYIYEFFIDIPILKSILEFLGKYSMNIYFIHNFVVQVYLNEYIYSFKNWIKIGMVLLIISLAISICIEILKRIIRYDKYIDMLQEFINKKIDKLYTIKEKKIKEGEKIYI